VHPYPEGHKAGPPSGNSTNAVEDGLGGCSASWWAHFMWKIKGGLVGSERDLGGQEEERHRFYDLQVAPVSVSVCQSSTFVSSSSSCSRPYPEGWVVVVPFI
jgi:hypothetical protein